MRVRTLFGPKKRAKTLMKPEDFHLVLVDYEDPAKESHIKCYNYHGRMLWKRPAMGKGVYGPSTHVRGGDTPPGLYRVGRLWVSKPWESKKKIWYPYGKFCYDLEELENQERRRKRSEICLHGGGSNAPDPLAPFQVLTPTHGCGRMHNYDLEHLVFPLTHTKNALGFYVRKKNEVYLSVYQDQDR